MQEQWMTDEGIQVLDGWTFQARTSYPHRVVDLSPFQLTRNTVLVRVCGSDYAIDVPADCCAARKSISRARRCMVCHIDTGVSSG